MNCPACGAPMRVSGDTLVCDFCKTVSVPTGDDEGVSVLGDGSGIACPICDLPLMQAAVARQSILYCRKCRGMVISMNVFPALVETLRARQQPAVLSLPADPNDLNRQINCPQCQKTMDTHFYAGPGNVIMDSCDTCNLNWLDHGELTRITRAPAYVEDESDSNTGDTGSRDIDNLRNADNQALNSPAYDTPDSDTGDTSTAAGSYARASDSSDDGDGSTTDDGTYCLDAQEARYEKDKIFMGLKIGAIVDQKIVDVMNGHGPAATTFLETLTDLL